MIIYIAVLSSVNPAPVVMMSKSLLEPYSITIVTRTYHIVSTTSTGYSAEEIARMLLNPEPSKVCDIQPVGVSKNATFIVDVDDVEFADPKADDLRTWKTNNTKSTCFWIQPSGTFVISGKQKGPDNKSYVTTRRYYVHGSYQLFCHVLTDITV